MAARATEVRKTGSVLEELTKGWGTDGQTVVE